MPQVSYCEPAQADEGTYTDTDADLVTQLRAGNESAIAHLVDQWSPVMLRVARSFVDSPQSAEDVVQDTWLGMLSGLAKFEGRSSLHMGVLDSGQPGEDAWRPRGQDAHLVFA
jgi:hypothetical protein